MKNQNGVVIELNSPTQGASLKPVTMPRIELLQRPCRTSAMQSVNLSLVRVLARGTPLAYLDGRPVKAPTIEKGVPQMEGQSKTTSSEIAWALVALAVQAFMLWINH